MYTKIRYSEIKDIESLKGYKLCYIKKLNGDVFNGDTLEWEDFKDSNKHLAMFFTDCPIEEQWGDDWDDAPYEYNAGEPYDSNYVNDTIIEHHIFEIDVPLKYDNGNGVPYYYQLPEDFGYNSPFSVEMINDGVIAWLYITQDNYNNPQRGVVIHGGDDIVDVFEKINCFIYKED